jgi:hypothetical protein
LSASADEQALGLGERGRWPSESDAIDTLARVIRAFSFDLERVPA